MYLVKNKHTQVIEPIGSITAVSGFTKIKENALYNTFSRNLMKIIPKVSNQLKSIVAIESYTEYEDVTESKPKVNALEEAKKAIAPNPESPAPQPEEPKKVEPKNDVPEMAF